MRNATSALLFFAALLAAQTESPTVQSHIRNVQSCLPELIEIKGEPQVCRTLAQRMAELHVPGVSIAVVHNGALEWAQGFGVARIGGALVQPGTLFQAGSISKPLAAMAALHLVQQGKLSLDADINTVLTSWKVPARAGAPDEHVTLRELLTHTGGVTVHGFPGYAAGAAVPTLVQVLNGEPPANTPPIRLQTAPGTRWNYSGGGYTVMQQAVVDVTGRPFARVLHDIVLQPIGMSHSTYQQPLPATFDTAATPYDSAGKPIPGGAHTYPEMAAAGLWTTPSDLAFYVLEVQQSLAGKANHVLSPELTAAMLKPGLGNWGLGLQIGGSPANPYFSHGGVNEGFESLFAAYEHSGDGAVVMTNAQHGSRLAAEVMSSIAVEYHWPDFLPKVHTAIKLAPSALARFSGVYQADSSLLLTVFWDGDHLAAKIGADQFPLVAESATSFFLKTVDAGIEFFPDRQGHIPYLLLRQGVQTIKAIRK